MINKLTIKMLPIVDNVMTFFDFMQRHQLLFALIAGLTLPFIISLEKDEHEKAPVWKRLIITSSFLCLIFGTLSPATTYLLQRLYPARYVINSPILLWSVLIFTTLTGIIFHYITGRLFAPELDRMKRRLVTKTRLERNTRTDVREIKSLLPVSAEYDPEQYIDLTRGVFIGLNENLAPQYIPLDDWQKQHADVIGTTGAGKGVATGLLIYQSILADEGVFEMDPKNDEWAPHLIRKACEDADKPFYLIDLNKPNYQLNLIAGITAEHLEELFIAGFSLAEKGEAADFYRIDDRRAARATAKLIDEMPNATLRDLFNSDYVQSIAETIKGFFGKTEELALLNSINAPDGLALKKIFDDGGCCYIIGSMRNSKIIATQRMILVRLMQLAELRDRVTSTPRPIAIHLAELKYHLSRPALEGLGAARDKGVHIIMDHQSVADLRDCPADLNGDAVVGAVVENAKFKLVYKLQDPDTALWVAKMSGTILVDDESRKAKTNKVLTEVIDDERTIRQAERYFIDSNMLLNLPKFVSYIFTATDLPKASLISPLKVKKRPLEIYEANFTMPPPVRKPLDFDEHIELPSPPNTLVPHITTIPTTSPKEPTSIPFPFDFDE